MKRELLDITHYKSGCCPGHDIFSSDTYNNNRSKRAKSRDKKKEHRYVRRIRKQELNAERSES